MWLYGASEQNVEWVTGWMDGYPLDCYDYYSTCGAKNSRGLGPYEKFLGFPLQRTGGNPVRLTLVLLDSMYTHAPKW